MAKRKIYAGSTGITIPLFILDSTSPTGGGLAGLTSATSGLVCKYRRQGQGNWTTVSLSAATLGTWSSGGLIADTGGAAGTYELGLPNAATSVGAQWVIVQLSGAANMVSVNIELELDAVNYQDNVRLGLSSLPNASAGAVGGVPTGDGAGRVLLQPAQSGVTIPTVTTLTGHTPQSGDAFARIGANGAALTALGDSRLAHLDAAISSRSTYTGSDSAGVTTLLSRLTATRAGLLDNLDAAISTRLALAGYSAPDNSTIATLAARLSAARALLLDNLENLDMAISDLPTADEISGELVGMTVASVEI